MHAGIPHPPGADAPLGADNPPDQTPRTRHTLPRDQTPPPGTGTLLDQTPPWDQVHPLGPGTPPGPGTAPLGPGTPPRTRYTPLGPGAPPRPGTPPNSFFGFFLGFFLYPPQKQTLAYGQRGAGTHPTGMHSCKENTTAFTKKEEKETVVDLHRQILHAPPLRPLFAKFFVIYVQFSGNIGRLAHPPPLHLVPSAKI